MTAPASKFNGTNDYEFINQQALQVLPDILEFFALDTKAVGREIQMLNPLRADGDFGSFSINTETGAWADFADDSLDSKAKGGDVISLVAYLKNLTQGDARILLQHIMHDLGSRSGQPGSGSQPPAVVGQAATMTSGGLARTPASAAPQPDVYEDPELTSPAKEGEAVLELNPARRGYGLPKDVHVYRDKHGRPVAAACRYETPKGKDFRPYVLSRQADSKKIIWKIGAPERLRPLYNRDLIEARQDAIIIICEGEKAADAAAKLFPDAVSTTTMNGAKSASKSDFRPLANRKVLVVPDYDAAGEAYCTDVVRLAQRVGASDIQIMRLKKEVFGKTVDGQVQDVPKGYDLADALADGWTAEKLRAVTKTIVESVIALEQPTSSPGVINPTPAKAPEGKVPLVKLVKGFVSAAFENRLKHDGNGFRTYRQGYWPMLKTVVEVEKPLSAYLDFRTSPSRIKEMCALMAIEYACSSEDFERPKQLICLENGSLDPITGVLHTHSPDHFLSNRLEIPWNPSASCPLWQLTLSEIFAPDADREQKISLLQEFFGYCLVADTTMHKFLWMVGGGGNGKSLVLSVMEQIIGKHNISHAQLDRIQDKFVRAELKGKLLNISSEMSAQSTVSDGYLKQIVAGDMLEAERKYEPSFSFKPYVRLIGATNELPRLLDHSEGFFRRAIILTFNRMFTATEQDRTREARLIEERAGIMTWAVAGLQRVMLNKVFTIPRSSVEALAQYRVESNNVQQFAEEFLEKTDNKNDWVKADQLFSTFREWVSNCGYKPLAISTFKTRMLALGFEQKRENSGRFWKVRYSGPYFIERFNPPSIAAASQAAIAYKV